MFKGDDHMQVALCRSDDVTGELFRSRVEKLARRLHRQDTKTHGINSDNRPGPGNNSATTHS